MASLHGRRFNEGNGEPPRGLQPHQLRAVAAPYLPFRQLVEEWPRSASTGNFQDLEGLLDQLAPPSLRGQSTNNRLKPRSRVGSCPAAHNRALFDRDDEERAEDER